MPSEIPSLRPPCAVLIGLDSLQGLQAARILARHKVPVIALAADPHHYACRTNVCERILHADTESEALISTLEALGPSLGQKAVLYPCEDANVVLVSRHRRRLEAWYHILLPPEEIVETLMSKVRFYEYAKAQGLPVPDTHVLRTKTDAERAGQAISFPCILKPSNSATPEWESHCPDSAFKVSSPEELLHLYDRYGSYSDTMLAQAFIDGPDTNHFSCNCYFSRDSEPLVTFTARKLRQWPPSTGTGCLSEECRNESVLEETLRLYRGVNYVGLGYLEMKKDERSGRYLIVEPNIGRPTGRSASAEFAGVELLYTMYCDALGWPLPPGREQTFKGRKWIYFRQDFQSAFFRWRKGELSLGEWCRSWRGTMDDAIFSCRDPRPFLCDVFRVVRLLLFDRRRRQEYFEADSH